VLNSAPPSSAGLFFVARADKGAMRGSVRGRPRNIPGRRLLEICNRTTGPHAVMDSETEKLRDEAWHYRDLRIRIADERVREALAQLIAEKEEQLRQIERCRP